MIDAFAVILIATAILAALAVAVFAFVIAFLTRDDT